MSVELQVNQIVVAYRISYANSIHGMCIDAILSPILVSSRDLAKSSIITINGQAESGSDKFQILLLD